MPTVLGHDGFEHGVALAGPIVGPYTVVNGSPTIVTTPVRTGLRALEISTTEVLENAGYTIAAGNRAVNSSFYVRFPSLPGETVIISHLLCSSGNPDIAYNFTSGTLAIRISGTASVNFGGTIATNTWYRVDWKVDTSTGTAQAWAQLDGGTEQTTTRVQTAADMTSIRLGTSLATHTYTAVFDDWVWSGTAADYPMGAHSVERLLPTADGTHSISGANEIERSATGTDITNSTTDAYTLVDDVPLDMAFTDYVADVGTSTTSYVEVLFEDLPAGTDVPHGVRGHTTDRDSITTGTSAAISRIVLDDGTSVSPDLRTSAADPGATATYRMAQLTAPGGTWDRTEVNGLRGRLGFGDGDPDTWFGSLMLEVALFPSAVTPVSTSDTGAATDSAVLTGPSPTTSDSGTSVESATVTTTFEWINSAEGGTDELVPTPANSGGASGQAWSAVQTGGSAFMVFDQLLTSDGDYAYRVASGAAQNTYLRWDTPSPTTLYMRAVFSIDAWPAANTAVMRSSESDLTQGYAVRIRSTGLCELVNAASGILAVNTTPLPIDTWVKVEAFGNQTTGAWEINYYYDPNATTPDETFSGSGASLGTGGFAEARYGSILGTGQFDLLYLDNLGVSNYRYPAIVDAFAAPGTSKSGSDTGAATDTAVVARVSSASDTAAAADSSSLSMGAVSKTASDVVPGTGGLQSLGFALALSGPPGVVESAVVTVPAGASKSGSDTIAGTDVAILTVQQPSTDTGAAGDASALAVQRPTTDTGAAGDASTLTVALVTSDTAVAPDVSTLAQSKVATDAAVATDASSPLVVAIPTTDTAAGVDVSAGISTARTDTGASAETPSLVAARSTTDDVGALDTSTVARWTFLRPDSTITAGGWVPVGAATLWEALDEETRSDSDYDEVTNPSSNAMEVGLTNAPLPASMVGTELSYAIEATSPTNVLVELVEGTTVRASWLHSSVPAGFTTWVRDLSPAEESAITSLADLRVRVTAGVP